jgi:hypothetical protein
MGEDGDYSIRLELAGYKMMSVPDDLNSKFGQGITSSPFPIYHKGNGTFADDETEKNSVILRNNQILNERYGLNHNPPPKI